MSVDPIGSPRNAAGLDGVERAVTRSAERTVDGQGGVDRNHEGDGVGSSAASKLRPYLAAGQATSPGREERIAALSAAVARGTYQVPIDALAKKLLGNGH